MTNSEEDIKALLKYFVNRETEMEKYFKEEQKTKNVKLILKIHHHNSMEKNGKDFLIVHTRLMQIKTDNNDNIEPNDKFYIKFQRINHHIRLFSNNDESDIHSTTIETIITRENSKCETVFKTIITNMHDGKKTKSQSSFTREVIKCKHNTGDSFDAHGFSRDISIDDPGSSNIAEKSDKFKIRKRTSFNKKKEGKTSKEATKKSKFNDTVNLEPIKKSKTRWGKRIKELFQMIPINDQINNNPITATRRRSEYYQKQASTEHCEMENKKATNIQAKIEINKNNENSQYIIRKDSLKQKGNFEIITDDIDFIDEDNNDDDGIIEFGERPTSLSNSYSNFNFPSLSENGPLLSLSMNDVCTCTERKIETITKFILSRIQKPEYNNQFDKIENYDEVSGHFINCAQSLNYSPSKLSPPQTIITKKQRKISIISTHSETQLDKIFQNLNDKEEINCSYTSIHYFTKDNLSYQEYKNGLSKILELELTLEHLVLFLYLTRTILMQIDDPISNNNNAIFRRINEFSEKYLLESYLKTVRKHGNIESFIKYCDEMKLDDVD